MKQSLNCSCFLNYPAINAQRVMRTTLQISALCSIGVNLIRKDMIQNTVGSFQLFQTSPQAVTMHYY